VNNWAVVFIGMNIFVLSLYLHSPSDSILWRGQPHWRTLLLYEKGRSSEQVLLELRMLGLLPEGY